MQPIVVVSEKSDRFAFELYRVFSAFRPTALTSSTDCAAEKDCEFQLIRWKKDSHKLPKNAVVAVSSGAEISERLKAFCFIADSADIGVLKTLGHQNIPVVTCGMSLRDTLSVSALSDDSMSLSLQRGIRTVKGGFLYARELQVKNIRGYDRRAVIFFAASVLLCGYTDGVFTLK